MNKTYAVSDMHGMLELWNKISNFCDDTDTIYFLGDAADRGPYGWETLMTIYNDPRVKFIKGNHEDMLINAIKQQNDNSCLKNDIELLYYNGGASTLEDYNKLTREEQDKWLEILEQLSERIDYINKNGEIIALTHAGFTPWKREESRDYIWDRVHLFYDWTSPLAENEKVDYIIHGHTPFVYIYEDGYDVLTKEQDENSVKNEFIHAVRYCGGRKICIDAGAFFTKQTILLDLDTFKEHYFICGDAD